jgi:hypothetical protein
VNPFDLTTSSTPTLDPARADQLRTFLSDEAAADLTNARTATAPLHRARRRVAIGAAAAVLLGGVVFAATSTIGGPGTRPAVAIERDAGWTTIRIVDIDADPQAVVDQLRQAGINARLGTLDVKRDGDKVTVTNKPGDGGEVASTFATTKVGDDGLVGLSVALPKGVTPPAQVDTDDGPRTSVGGADGDGPSTVRHGDPSGGNDATFDHQLEDLGIRFSTDGTVSIRNGSAKTVVVRVER